MKRRERTMIEELHDVSRARFREEIVPAARPVVLRSLVRDWPVVAAASRSTVALGDYLGRFDRGRALGAMVGPPRIGGRFFYNDDLGGFNFRRQTVKLDAAFDFLARSENQDGAPAFAIQSAQVWSNLPGFDAENALPLLESDVEPRIWLGNRVTVAAHFDPSENIACVVAGRRRFTLFPPDAIGDLYMGPMERTPAGTTISMVDFDAPDPAAHPRFATAMKRALIADLSPGDAIFIPYMWWHHVRSLDRVNMLVNYWWKPAQPDAGHPMDAMLHAMMTIRGLPPAHRDAWRAHFEHYVFSGGDDARAHLPAKRQGILGELDDDRRRDLKDAVRRGLDRDQRDEQT